MVPIIPTWSDDLMPFTITDEEIIEVVKKFDVTKKEYPQFIRAISADKIKVVADYLGQSVIGKPDRETWDMIAGDGIYGYACFIHEYIEAKLVEKGKPRIIHHGRALYFQYYFLSRYIERETGQEYDVIKLCCADSWKKDPVGGMKKDYSNSEKLERYLKERDDRRYNRIKHTFNIWSDVSFQLRRTMNSIRETGMVP